VIKWVINKNFLSCPFVGQDDQQIILPQMGVQEVLIFLDFYRRFSGSCGVFSCDTSLLKALHLATYELTKEWAVPVWN